MFPFLFFKVLNMFLVVQLATFMYTFCQISGTVTPKKLECGTVIQVDSGQDGVLHCSVILGGESSRDVMIEQVVWWKKDQNHHRTHPPVFQYSLDGQQPNDPRFLPSQRYQLAGSFGVEEEGDLSLLVRKAQPADEGLYECVVATNLGQWNCTIILEVTGPMLKDPEDQNEMPKRNLMWLAAVFVVVGSLASGLLLLKLFQTTTP
ncbi:uncharacterized protein LOC117595269 [Esox lucius]|uniref:uncharacterized protein LOC117595269 n=1 Tax=Esox lucius TaxID=8010 RepID=UPI001476EBC2|nr:uncharacterized protein LOC117595269 [Esox lucius]